MVCFSRILVGIIQTIRMSICFSFLCLRNGNRLQRLFYGSKNEGRHQYSHQCTYLRQQTSSCYLGHQPKYLPPYIYASIFQGQSKGHSRHRSQHHPHLSEQEIQGQESTSYYSSLCAFD